MKKLKKVLVKELPDKYIWQDRFTDFHFPFLFAKVREKDSFIKEEYSHKLKNSGLFIDIIPVEKIVSFKIKAFLDYVYGHSVRTIHSGYTSISDMVKSYMCFLPSRLTIAIIRLYTIFSKNTLIGHIYGWRSYNLISAKDIFPLTEVTFDGYKFLSPANAHNYLTSLFNEYMKIPPEEKRETHAMEIEFFE